MQTHTHTTHKPTKMWPHTNIHLLHASAETGSHTLTSFIWVTHPSTNPRQANQCKPPQVLTVFSYLQLWPPQLRLRPSQRRQRIQFGEWWWWGGFETFTHCWTVLFCLISTTAWLTLCLPSVHTPSPLPLPNPTLLVRRPMLHSYAAYFIYV